MTYADRLARQTARAERRSTAALTRQARARSTFEQIQDSIPLGQPILVGHHSERRHRKALGALDRNLGAMVAEGKNAAHAQRTATQHGKRAAALAEAIAHDPSGCATGDTVIASFTNSGRIHRFRGIIIDRTLRDWKVRALESVYDADPEGRVFTIAAYGNRKHSTNNGIKAAS